MNRIADPTSLVLARNTLFLEEMDPYTGPDVQAFDLTDTKRTLIAAIRLLPELTDEFEQGLNAKTRGGLGAAPGTVTAKTRLQRARERFPVLVDLILGAAYHSPRDHHSWTTSSLLANTRVMHSSLAVFTDLIRELGFHDIPLQWGLFPSEKFPGTDSMEGLKPFHNHFLMVGACFHRGPVFEDGYSDEYESFPGNYTDALLKAENALTLRIWQALVSRGNR